MIKRSRTCSIFRKREQDSWLEREGEETTLREEGINKTNGL